MPGEEGGRVEMRRRISLGRFVGFRGLPWVDTANRGFVRRVRRLTLW